DGHPSMRSLFAGHRGRQRNNTGEIYDFRGKITTSTQSTAKWTGQMEVAVEVDLRTSVEAWESLNIFEFLRPEKRCADFEKLLVFVLRHWRPCFCSWVQLHKVTI